MSTLEQDISTLDKELFSLLKNKQAARYKEHRNRRPPSPCALTCHKDSTENVEEGTPRLTFRQTLSLRHLGMTSIQPQSESKAAFKPDNQFSSIIAAEIRAYLCSPCLANLFRVSNTDVFLYVFQLHPTALPTTWSSL